MRTREYESDEERRAQAEFDEIAAHTLDFDSIIDPANWQTPGDYYQTMPATTRTSVHRVVEDDERLRREVRAMFPEAVRTGSIRWWGRADQNYIETPQRKRLYSGQVVAADATLSTYDTLSLIGAQIAVSKVNYQHSTGQIVSNIMHWGKEL